MPAGNRPHEVVISLPAPEKALGLRPAFENLAGMRARDVAENCVAFAPVEETTPYAYLDAVRLCDARTPLAEDLLTPLLANPRVEPDDAMRKQLLEWVERVADERPESVISAFKARLMGTAVNDVPRFLVNELPAFFAAYPEGSLWFVKTDDLFHRRFTLLRMLVASRLAPDVFDQNALGPPVHVATLTEQSLSRGLDTGKLMNPMLLVFSPATVGFTLQWLPHTLVFLTGATVSMVRDFPATPWALYDPGLQTPFVPMSRYSDFIVDVPQAEIEALFQWWVRQLNNVYTYLLDPRNFADKFALHQPLLQIGWYLTFERLLADLTIVQTGFSQPELSRQQAAFDLLDKLEVMLGFGTKETGQGFVRLLGRASMEPKLDAIWMKLPIQLRGRFRDYGGRLYDALYSEVRAHAYPHRRTSAGVKVWSEANSQLEERPDDIYVPQLVRAVRNSAHGFIHVLTSDQKQARRDRAVLGGHDGKLPPEVADLAGLLAFAFVAGFTEVIDGAWR